MSTYTNDSALREEAIRRLKERRDLATHVVVYLLVNGFLVGLWAMTSYPGFFWPAIPMFAWGIGLVMNAWDVYFRRSITDEEIDREVARMRH